MDNISHVLIALRLTRGKVYAKLTDNIDLGGCLESYDEWGERRGIVGSVRREDAFAFLQVSYIFFLFFQLYE